MKLQKHLVAAAMAALIASLALPPAVMADPPSHAPAHGWRKKNDPYYVGYTGHQWSDDYGIREGHCDRDRVGTALGAVVGGAVGAAASDGDNQLIAILAGATIGAIIGHEIGDQMDDRDHACFGHSLELLEDGHRVLWDGPRKRHGLHADARPSLRARRPHLPPLHDLARIRRPPSCETRQRLSLRRRRLADDRVLISDARRLYGRRACRYAVLPGEGA